MAIQLVDGKRDDVGVLRCECSKCGQWTQLVVVGRKAGQAWIDSGASADDLVDWLGFLAKADFARVHQAIKGELVCSNCYSLSLAKRQTGSK